MLINKTILTGFICHLRVHKARLWAIWAEPIASRLKPSGNTLVEPEPQPDITLEMTRRNWPILPGMANSSEETHPAGDKKPNAWGLYDMHGNVWEWCQDAWHANYQDAPTDGSSWMSENDNYSHVLRGGSWNFIPRYCRSAYRNVNSPDSRNYYGFRVVYSSARILL